MGKSYWALWRKFRIIPPVQKVKLAVKVLLRIFGIRMPLFIGGYDLKVDEKQKRQDRLIAKNLNMQKIADTRKITGRMYARARYESNRYGMNNLVLSIPERNSNVKFPSYIALMTDYLHQGGLEEVVQLLALEYQKRRIAVKVFCVYQGGRIARRLVRRHITVVSFYGNRKKFAEYLSVNRPYLVNTHSVSDFTDIINKQKIPVIEVIHNMYVYLTPGRIAMERNKIHDICCYIAVSDCVRDIFIQKMYRGSLEQKHRHVVPICVIGNTGRRLSKLQKDRKQIRQQFRIASDAFVFLMAGSIDPRKNQIGAVRALSILTSCISRPVALVLAGAVTDVEYEWKLRSVISERGLNDWVMMTGYQEQIADLMYASDVYLVDSYYEGWSMSATEALCCGLPLIHSWCGSGVELTAGGRNGILIDNPIKNIGSISDISLINDMHAGINENMEQLVSAMLEMIEHEPYWKQKQTEIAAYAHKHFSTEQMINQYLAVYAQI